VGELEGRERWFDTRLRSMKDQDRVDSSGLVAYFN